jgi:hypothetical protein
VQLYRLVNLAPVSPLLCCGMLLPLLLSWANREAYICWRDQLVVAMRLYVVAVLAHVSLKSYQVRLLGCCQSSYHTICQFRCPQRGAASWYTCP